MSDTPDLSEGDFLYQADQEIFLVVTGEGEESYHLAVHGWREIDKERLDEYISHSNSKLHKQSDVIEDVENKASEEQQTNFEKLRQMFEVYADLDLGEDGPHKEWALDDTP